MLKKLLSTLSQLIYPEICLGCDREPPLEDSDFCLSCELGVPLVNVLKDSGSYLIGKPSFPDGLDFFSYFYFSEGNIAQKLIHHIKYKSRKDLANRYGAKFGKTLMQRNWTDFVIIPVPIHPKKKLERGYNQAEQIAKGMSEVLKIPMNTKLLIRTIYESSQTKKNRNQRQEIRLMSFKAGSEKNIPTRKVLLVDDVVTTGSTISACVQQLESLGIKEIKVASLAVAI